MLLTIVLLNGKKNMVKVYHLELTPESDEPVKHFNS
jgi:hypothetical protein